MRRHSAVDVASNSAGREAFGDPSHMNNSWTIGAKSLVSPSDVTEVDGKLATPLSPNILAQKKCIYVFKVPSHSSVVVSASVAYLDSGSGHTVFAASPALLQGVHYAFINTRRSRHLLIAHKALYLVLLYKTSVTSKCYFPSMHPTSALCDAPTALSVRLRNGALISASPQMMFYMTGSTCAFPPPFFSLSLSLTFSAAASNDAPKSPPRSFVAISFQLGLVVVMCLSLFALCISILMRLQFLPQVIFPPSFCRRLRSYATTMMHAIGSCAVFALLMMPLCVTAQAVQSHSCAIASGGGVKCWGLNVYGQVMLCGVDFSGVGVSVCCFGRQLLVTDDFGFCSSETAQQSTA
jgi:hypothetical protein